MVTGTGIGVSPYMSPITNETNYLSLNMHSLKEGLLAKHRIGNFYYISNRSSSLERAKKNMQQKQGIGKIQLGLLTLSAGSQ